MSRSDRDDSVSRRGALKLFLAPLTGIAVQRLLGGCSEHDLDQSDRDSTAQDESAAQDDDEDTEDTEDTGDTEDTDDGASEESDVDDQIDAGTKAPIDSGKGSLDSSKVRSDASTSDANDVQAADAQDAMASENVADANVPWASGGTKSMRGGYPDPFVDDPGTTCSLSKAMILGPCYADTLEREDISESVLGVPMRISLLVVRADGCTPVSGATVDIWHARADGVYSQFAAGTQCNPGRENLTTPKFCRGVQTTDANGRVDFSSVVPGWYAGRATHLHFTVRLEGEEWVTSQLFWDDALLDEIERQTDYKAHGTRDTRNTADLILPADDISPYVFSTAKRADGALHAWKVIALRSSLEEELPSAGGLIDGDFPFPGLGG